jgi:XTP/dITP diphosphohydrolase
VRPSRLVFVTSNAGKAREAGRFLGREVLPRALDVPEIQSLDFESVVRAKALAAVQLLSLARGEAALVEDSGLEVEAWNGFPGPLTRWLTASVGEAGLARMLDPWPDRRASAVSALGLASPGDRPSDVRVVLGRHPGALAASPRGGNGFGWDVLFVPEGEERTFAEMSADEKDADSHRARAFRALAELLRA